MRLAEKTIELNFCAQLGAALHQQILWFGLTQKQEARAGYDAYARLGGRLLALQFKASNHLLLSGERRFHAQHHQLLALRTLGQRRSRSVFYVFPSLGNTRELSRNTDLVTQCQLLDAGTIPNAIGAPTRRNGGVRKSGRHYVDVISRSATIHSEPVTVMLEGVSVLLDAPTAISREEGSQDRIESKLGIRTERSWFEHLVRAATGAAVGVVILP
jgi:hypothetical protein